MNSIWVFLQLYFNATTIMHVINTLQITNVLSITFYISVPSCNSDLAWTLIWLMTLKNEKLMF